MFWQVGTPDGVEIIEHVAVAIQTVSTQVSVDLSGGDLLVTDINGGVSNDDLTITADGTNITITSNNGELIDLVGGLDGGTGDGTATVTILQYAAGTGFTQSLAPTSSSADHFSTPAVLVGDAADATYVPPNPSSGGGGTAWLTLEDGSTGVAIDFNFASATDLDQLLMWDFYKHTPTDWNIQLFDAAGGGGTKLLDHDFTIPVDGSIFDSELHTTDIPNVSGALSGILTTRNNSANFGVGLSEIAFLSPVINTIDINTLGGNDIVNVAGLTLTTDQSLDINAGSENDSINFQSTATSLTGTGTATVIGGTITNTAPLTTVGGAVSLVANNGVTLSGANADVTTGGGTVTIDADADDNGTGHSARTMRAAL